MTGINGRPGRVLVIGNDSGSYEAVREILGGREPHDEAFLAEGASSSRDEAPFRVECTIHPCDGLALLAAGADESDPFDVAFVDLPAPPGGASRVIEQLWNADPDLQIVVCSSHSDHPWDGVSGLPRAPDNLLLLRKPFESAEAAQCASVLKAKRRLALDATDKMKLLSRVVMTRTRELEEAHHESESHLAAIASLLIGIDAEGTIKRWNQTAAAVFGVEPEHAIGRRLDNLPIAWSNREQLQSFLGPDDSQNEKRVEVCFCDAADRRRLLAFTAYRITRYERPGGLLLLGREITEQRALELHLQQARKLEAIGQLAAGVAHEINTPMQYIGDNLAYLKSTFERLHAVVDHCVRLIDPATDSGTRPDLIAGLDSQMTLARWQCVAGQIQEALDDSAEGVQHVSCIVRALKEFSHPDGTEKTTVDLNRALETTVTIAKSEWRYVATVEMCLDPSLGVVRALAGDLNQVFLNLIVNAAQAIAERFEGRQCGRIRISTCRSGGYARVSIADNGGGIPHTARDRVFDPFFTTKEVGKGTGQGLALAHSVIVAKHQGRIWFEVEDGVGTTFYVEIPLNPDECETRVAEKQAPGVGEKEPPHATAVCG